jgi:hypothetical protein
MPSASGEPPAASRSWWESVRTSPWPRSVRLPNGGYLGGQPQGSGCSATGIPSVSIYGWQTSQLQTDYVAQPRSASSATVDPVGGIMRVILVKLILGCSGSGVPRWRRWC